MARRAAGRAADMGPLCHHQLPPAAPQRSPRKAADGAALPGSPLLLLFVLLASSMSACKGAPMPSQALESDEDLQLLKESSAVFSSSTSSCMSPILTSAMRLALEGALVIFFSGEKLVSWEWITQEKTCLEINFVCSRNGSEFINENFIDDACSAYLSTDSQPRMSQTEVSSTLEELCFLVVGFLQKPQGLDEKDNTKRFLFHYSKTHDSGNSDIMSSVLHPLLQLVPQLNERRLKRYKLDEELQGPGIIQSRGYFFYRPRNGRRSVEFR